MNQSVLQQMCQAVEVGDIGTIREIVAKYPEVLLQPSIGGGTWLHYAAWEGNAAVVEALVDLGIDVNALGFEGHDDVVLSDAASEGHLEIVRWLLDHGAKPNGVPGQGGGPLVAAVIAGHRGIVSLLLERGADPTQTYGVPPKNALTAAEHFGRREIARLLRKRGVRPPDGGGASGPKDEITLHLEKYLGPVRPVALTSIVPGVRIQVVEPTGSKPCLALVTAGMSEAAMPVRAAAQHLQFAELLIRLPVGWPLDIESLRDSRNSWPIRWLSRVAHYPLEAEEGLNIGTIVDNQDPPQPLGEGTRLACLLVVPAPNHMPHLVTTGGKTINFYELVPLYPEERALEMAQGLPRLMTLLAQHGVPGVIDPVRVNVATI